MFLRFCSNRFHLGWLLSMIVFTRKFSGRFGTWTLTIVRTILFRTNSFDLSPFSRISLPLLTTFTKIPIDKWVSPMNINYLSTWKRFILLSVYDELKDNSNLSFVSFFSQYFFLLCMQTWLFHSHVPRSASDMIVHNVSINSSHTFPWGFICFVSHLGLFEIDRTLI